MTSPVTLAEVVAAEVRAEMGRQRISYATLAQAIGKSDMYLSRRLGGTGEKTIPLDLADVEAIAKHLGVPALRLMQAEQRADAR